MSPGTATAHKAHNPAPRTPLPAATFDGTLELSGRAIELDGWRGMVGHNWGSGHADRWIWVHGVGFAEEPLAWLQLALGRVRLAGRMTPWVASGALSLDGHRHRVGGLRRAHVSESARGCTLALAGERRLLVRAEARVPEGSAAAWRY